MLTVGDDTRCPDARRATPTRSVGPGHLGVFVRLTTRPALFRGSPRPSAFELCVVRPGGAPEAGHLRPCRLRRRITVAVLGGLSRFSRRNIRC
jgi:hypothetical protein